MGGGYKQVIGTIWNQHFRTGSLFSKKFNSLSIISHMVTTNSPCEFYVIFFIFTKNH